MFWFLLLLTALISCTKSLTSSVEDKSSHIFETDKIDFTLDELRPFYPYILELKPKYISFMLGKETSSLKAYLPDQGIFVELRKKGAMIQKLPPKKLSRNEMLFFANIIPTPTPTFIYILTPTPPEIKKPKRNKVTQKQQTPRIQSTVPTVTPGPSQIVWSDDKIALEILKGNAPRDRYGNILHKASGDETLTEIVEWYCGNTEHLEEISKFNDDLPVDAKLVEGVEVKIPSKYVVNTKKYKK